MADELRLRAYYYGFEPTGEVLLDRVISAVACAGKAYHHTESWSEETPPYHECFRGKTPEDWIQNAAFDVADELKTLRTQLALKDKALREVEWKGCAIRAINGEEESFWACPWCRNTKDEGHASDCLIAQSLSPSMTDAK